MSRILLVAATLAGWLVAAVAKEPPMVTPQDLLKNPKFKAAYVSALGNHAKQPWLARLSNSALVREVKLGGHTWQVATPCKPHDCADNNLLLLYAPATGMVHAKLYEKGRSTLLGSPDAAMAAELDKLWKKEFRQQ